MTDTTTVADQLTIAVIGAGGKMGMRVSNNLVKTSHTVFYSEVSPAGQERVTEAGRELTETDAADESMPVSRALSDKSFAALKTAGMQINELSPAEQKRLRDAVKPVYDKHSATIGKETVDRMNATLSKIRGS
jgi:TRAP-type C4-dicarboxylate transport system substrate-binding protein